MSYQQPDIMRYTAQFRQALAEGNYMDMWQLMIVAFPGAPAPKTPEQAEIIMHRIRTETESISNRLRCYSDCWLVERNYPSALPDKLKPLSMRLYPRVVDGVGIAVRMPKIFQEIGIQVQASMEGAVEELAADRKDLSDRPLVHGLMFERRRHTLKSFGIKSK